MMRFPMPFRRSSTLRFACEADDHGVIATPFPARDYLPNWFRKLPAITESEVSATNSGITIKRCMPFLDAMTTGWIIPLPATVRLEVRDEGRFIEAGWDHHKPLVSFHGAHQVKGNPMGERAACKFHNPWTIVTPKGWSCLFVNPLNRPNGMFEIMAGVVDTDSYRAPVHFPFFFTGPDGMHVIEKGSPIVQVIPFPRDSTLISAEIGTETGQEAEDRTRIASQTRASDGWYRTAARARR